MRSSEQYPAIGLPSDEPQSGAYLRQGRRMSSRLARALDHKVRISIAVAVLLLLGGIGLIASMLWTQHEIRQGYESLQFSAALQSSFEQSRILESAYRVDGQIATHAAWQASLDRSRQALAGLRSTVASKAGPGTRAAELQRLLAQRATLAGELPAADASEPRPRSLDAPVRGSHPRIEAQLDSILHDLDRDVQQQLRDRQAF